MEGLPSFLTLPKNSLCQSTTGGGVAFEHAGQLSDGVAQGVPASAPAAWLPKGRRRGRSKGVGHREDCAYKAPQNGTTIMAAMAVVERYPADP